MTDKILQILKDKVSIKDVLSKILILKKAKMVWWKIALFFTIILDRIF